MIFKNYRESFVINEHLESKHIIVGDHTYYSGYYHQKPFEDCVMYLDKLDDDQDPLTIDRLIIGKFCSIASGVKFMMGGNQGHNHQWIATYPLDIFEYDFDHYKTKPPKAYKLKGDTIIGNDVWIGAEALIMPGVHVGDGAVIAARAVVTKNIGPYEIWGGNPAKLIKKRFNDHEIEKLQKIKWWDWKMDVLKTNLNFLRSNDVETLWKKYKEGKL